MLGLKLPFSRPQLSGLTDICFFITFVTSFNNFMAPVGFIFLHFPHINPVLLQTYSAFSSSRLHHYLPQSRYGVCDTLKCPR
ncbi:hypothetical protein BDW62DRAFT_41939 [Aspergillus aurantiobrunneus]